MRTDSPALAGTVANEWVDSPHKYAMTPCSRERRWANGMRCLPTKLAVGDPDDMDARYHPH